MGGCIKARKIRNRERPVVAEERLVSGERVEPGMLSADLRLLEHLRVVHRSNDSQTLMAEC